MYGDARACMYFLFCWAFFFPVRGFSRCVTRWAIGSVMVGGGFCVGFFGHSLVPLTFFFWFLSFFFFGVCFLVLTFKSFFSLYSFIVFLGHCCELWCCGPLSSLRCRFYLALPELSGEKYMSIVVGEGVLISLWLSCSLIALFINGWLFTVCFVKFCIQRWRAFLFLVKR